MVADLTAPEFTDADKAREVLEAERWPNGPVCPHCGVINEAYKLEPKPGAKTHARKGVWKCAACREQFSVTIGTIFEDSHIPLNKWLMAIHLLCASKKGMSAHQLHRMLGIAAGKTPSSIQDQVQSRQSPRCRPHAVHERNGRHFLLQCPDLL